MSRYGIYARVVNVSEMSLVRSLVITTFWMESVSLGIIQLKLVFIKFSFLCDMNESSSRLRTPKTFDEEKDCLSILFQNLRLHEQMGVADFFENGKTKKRTRFAPFSLANCSKVKTWGGCSRVD